MALWSRYLFSKKGGNAPSFSIVNKGEGLNKGNACPRFFHSLKYMNVSLVLRDQVVVLITQLEQKGALSVDVFGYLLGDLQCFVY